MGKEKEIQHKSIAGIIRGCSKSISRNVILIGAILLIGSVFSKYAMVYRDSQDRFELDTGFESSQLSMIYTTEDRARVTDELIAELENLTDPGDDIILANEMPMFYYLTETHPTYGDGWLFIKPLETIEEIHNDSISEGRYPRLFVYSKVCTSSDNWPNVNQTTEGKAEQEMLDYLIATYVDGLGYVPLWENDAFVIYGNPEIFNG